MNLSCVWGAPGAEDGQSGSGGSAEERKKRPRTAFSATQIKALEAEFEKNKYLSVSKRMQLSKQLKLTETQVRGPSLEGHLLLLLLLLILFNLA